MPNVGAKVHLSSGTGSGSGNATSIQGTPVSATPPTPGQTLVDVGGTYTPQTPASFPLSAPVAGALAAPYQLTTAFTTFMTTASLGVGTWLINMAGVAYADGATSTWCAIKAVLGTATATFAGQYTDETAWASNASGEQKIGLCFLATVTVAGTIAFQALAASTTPAILSTTAQSFTADCTGWTATRVA